jgi:hypothetical protein
MAEMEDSWDPSICVKFLGIVRPENLDNTGHEEVDVNLMAKLCWERVE